MMTLPSLLPIIIALSEAPDLITKLPRKFENPPNTVPPSFILTSPPLASRIISPSTSSVKSAPSDIVEPFIVISSTVRVVSVPRLVMFV